MIIDEALAAPRYSALPRKYWDYLVSARHRAESFVFTDNASELLGRFTRECGDLILRNRQFAIPPFNTCYIELPFRPFIEVPNNSEADTYVGYLIDGNKLFTFASNDTHLPSEASLFYWTIAQPGTTVPVCSMGNQVEFLSDPNSGITEQQLETITLIVALGTTFHKVHGADEMQALNSELTLYYVGPTGVNERTMLNVLLNSAGDVRNLWAALLWLNRPAHVSYIGVPASRHISKGRIIVYKAHRTVEIDLHKHRSVRRAFTLSGPRLSPRRHNVRGAFHHSGGSFACSHQWPLLPDDNKWTCTECGRQRWWVRDHVRGDSTRGWVDHDYAVTTGTETRNKHDTNHA